MTKIELKKTIIKIINKCKKDDKILNTLIARILIIFKDYKDIDFEILKNGHRDEKFHLVTSILGWHLTYSYQPKILNNLIHDIL